MTKKMSKKMFTSLMVAIMLISVLATCAYAASETVYISGRLAVHSDSISSSNGANCNGYNSTDSQDRLFMTLEYSDGGGWANEAVTAMQKGCYGSLSSSRSGTLLWRVTLNPDDLAYCIGWGTVINN